MCKTQLVHYPVYFPIRKEQSGVTDTGQAAVNHINTMLDTAQASSELFEIDAGSALTDTG